MPSRSKRPKTSAKKTRAPSKSDFIRAELARGVSPAAIVAAAAAKGIKFHPNLVYKLRGKVGKKRVSPPSAAKAPAASSAPSGATPKVVGRPGSASAFVRLHPNKTAGEVIALGKAAGLKITKTTVYAARAYARSKGAGKAGASTKVKASARSKPAFVLPSFGGGGSEAELKRVALAVGFPRAQQVVEELARRVVAVQRQYEALLG